MQIKITSGLLIISLLLLSIACTSNQNVKTPTQTNKPPETQSNVQTAEICNYYTKENTKSEGLNVKISYPCSWSLKEGDRPHVVQKFSKPTTDTTLVNGMIIITKMPGEGTQEEIKDLLSPSNLPSYVDANTDKVISSKGFTIDGEIAGELIFETSRNTPVGMFYMKSVEYLMFYKNYFIRLQYATGSQSESKTVELFSKNQKLFAALATSTVLMTKWEGLNK